MPAEVEVLLLGTSECPAAKLDADVRRLFMRGMEMELPSAAALQTLADRWCEYIRTPPLPPPVEVALVETSELEAEEEPTPQQPRSRRSGRFARRAEDLPARTLTSQEEVGCGDGGGEDSFLDRLFFLPQNTLLKIEEATLRQLRMYLRNVLARLSRTIKYRAFATSGAFEDVQIAP